MKTYAYAYETRERLETEFRNGESLADFALALLNEIGSQGKRVVNVATFERPSDKFIAGTPITVFGITLVVEAEAEEEHH